MIDQLLESLARSQLVPRPEVDALRERLSPIEASDPKALVERLVKDRVITRWQGEQLLAGRQGFYVGNYKLLDRIGVGGMGAVYKAEQIGLQRVVALKILNPDLVKKKQAVARFEREMRLVSALNHPNIVKAYDAQQINGNYVLVMEHVDGRNLNQWIRHCGAAPVWWACECMRQAAVALDHGHRHGLVHRDIKPGNLLVQAADYENWPTLKVLDLGLARTADDEEADAGQRLTRQGQVLGTPDYIAPEQVMDSRSADIRADIFSLGASIYKLLTGRVPFEGESAMDKLMARHTCPTPRVRTYRPEIPEEIDAVIAKAMARDPEDRYQTPEDLAEAIAPYADPERSYNKLETPSQLMHHLEAEDPPTDASSRTVIGKPIESPVTTAAPVSVAVNATAQPQFRTASKPKSPAAAKRKLPLRDALIVVGVMLLSAAGVWWYSQPTRLVVHWPVAERAGAGLMIDGVIYPIGDQDPISIDINPGAHEVILRRENFPPIVWNISADRGDDVVRRPEWGRGSR